MITVKIIKDSINQDGNRLITWYLKYHRFIHAEFLRHRVLSHSVSSSRAITIQRMIDNVKENPAIPIKWGKNQKGMQAFEELDFTNQILSKGAWLEARDKAVESAERLANIGCHKQIVNRILEPFCFTEEVCSGTEWANYFNLRVSKFAQPEICELARLMLLEYQNSVPDKLEWGEWHIPFVSDETYKDIALFDKLRISTAICARASYATFKGKPDIQDDIKLHDNLVSSKHWSPLEHQAISIPGIWGNFNGWRQYRKIFTNENQTDINPKLLEELL